MVHPDWSPTCLDHIVVMGQIITIKHRKPKKSSYGEYKANTRVIELNDDLKGEFGLRVLIHEVTHAALSVCGVDYHINAATEEQVCTIMESMIIDLITRLIGDSEDDGGDN